MTTETTVEQAETRAEAKQRKRREKGFYGEVRVTAQNATVDALLADVTRYALEDTVPVKECFAEPVYARPTSAARVREIAQHWRDAAVGVIYVSLRNHPLPGEGHYAILDGCHRVEAARQALGPDATLPARVYMDLSVEQEAALFDAFNRMRRRPSSSETFRNQLAFGEPTAQRLVELVEQAGMEIALDGIKRDGAIVAIHRLHRVYQIVGDEGLVEVLSVLRDAFDSASAALSSDVLGGMAAFWIRYHEVYDRDRLVTKLQECGVEALVARAKLIRSAFTGYDAVGSVGLAIREEYNERLQTKQLGEWQARGVYGPRGAAVQAENREHFLSAEVQAKARYASNHSFDGRGVSIEEVVRLTGKTYWDVRNLVTSGLLPSYYEGNRRWIEVSAVPEAVADAAQHAAQNGS